MGSTCHPDLRNAQVASQLGTGQGYAGVARVPRVSFGTIPLVHPTATLFGQLEWKRSAHNLGTLHPGKIALLPKWHSYVAIDMSSRSPPFPHPTPSHPAFHANHGNTRGHSRGRNNAIVGDRAFLAAAQLPTLGCASCLLLSMRVLDLLKRACNRSDPWSYSTPAACSL